MNERWEFSVEQSGIVVASGEAANEEDAKREAVHYALMYSQDGTVKVSIKQCLEEEECGYCGGTGEVACSSTNYMSCPACSKK